MSRSDPMSARCPACRAKPGQPCVIAGSDARDGDAHLARRDPMAPLHGVQELRAAVRWANAQYESEHENMTAEEILARFRKERDA